MSQEGKAQWEDLSDKQLQQVLDILKKDEDLHSKEFVSEIKELVQERQSK